MTLLGMPGRPPAAPTFPTWKAAWDTALYAPDGYLRHHAATLTGDLEQLFALVIEHWQGRRDIALIGSAVRLARRLHDELPEVQLRAAVPSGFTGLVVAADWLSHVPVHVVGMRDDDKPAVLHVGPDGDEQWGAALQETTVSTALGRWLEPWWDIVEAGHRDGRGARAEVGTGRDSAATAMIDRLGPGGTCLFVDPGHLRDQRPFDGSLVGDDGRRPRPDGHHDLWSGVAWDSVVATGGLDLVAGTERRPTYLIADRAA